MDDKPLGSVVATHHHLDQTGGLRAVAGAGAAVFISREAQPWLAAALTRPLTRRPDPLLQRREPLQLEAVSERRVLEDAQRPVELHAVRNSPHAQGMLMVWLPRERLLVHAEADGPGASGGPGSAQGPGSALQNLLDNVARLGLAPLQFVSLYKGRQDAAEVYRAAGRILPH